MSYFQSGARTWHEGAIMRVLTSLVKEPCFGTLRTKEQLGYIVSTQYDPRSAVAGITI